MAAERSNKQKRGKGLKTRMPLLLVDMRRVYSEEKAATSTPGQKALAAMLRDEPARFLERMCRLEEAHVRRQEANRPPSPDTPPCGQHGEDEGECAVLGAIERLLDEWERNPV